MDFEQIKHICHEDECEDWFSGYFDCQDCNEESDCDTHKKRYECKCTRTVTETRMK